MDEMERKIRLAEIPKLIDQAHAQIATLSEEIAAREEKRAGLMASVLEMQREQLTLMKQSA